MEVDVVYPPSLRTARLEHGAEVAGAVGVLEEAEDVGGDEVLHFGVLGGYFAVFGC